MVATMMFGCVAFAQNANGRQIRMPSEGAMNVSQNDYTSYEKGFFMSGELSGGYSLNSGKENMGFTEIDATGGYRFSEFLRAGIGLGARVYIGANNARYVAHKWGLPLYINLRGNFIPMAYRNAVPFWSVDAGTTFPDGVMVRPTVGVRIGQNRSAFIASIGYLGQNIRVLHEMNVKHDFYSFITLKLGYEF